MCRRHGDAERGARCVVEGCGAVRLARGYCTTHYHRWRTSGGPGEAARRRKGKRPCRVSECQNDAVTSDDLCPTHRRRKRLYGAEDGTLSTHLPCAVCGEPSMHGMRFVDRCETHAWDRVLDLHLAGEYAGVISGGYVYLTVRKKRRPVHQLVMERMLGRRLLPGETPHHMNGRRDDNRPENLELWVKPQVPGQRVQDLVDFVVENYPEYVRAAIDGRPQLFLK
jgi:hypothetical protein